MTEAPPTGDEVLTPNDAVKVLEELLPAQNQSYELGLKLNLKPHEVKSIHTTYSEPRRRLLHVVIEFLNEVEPSPPTWKVIVDALKSPVVNLPHLAKAVEAAHCPDTTSTPVPNASVPVSQSPVTSSQQPGPSSSPLPGEVLKVSTNSGASPLTEVDYTPDLPQPSAATGDSLTELQHRPESPTPNPVTSQYVQAKIRRFEKKFNEMKKAARGCLEKRKISVKQVVDALTSMPADDIEEHKLFLKDNLSDLYHSFDISELIGKLSLLQWNYLSYQLLDYLIKEFGLEVGREMEAYKLDLQRFRQKTPLALFCRCQKRRRRKPSEEFKEMVAEFDWPHEVTLEVVEQFRQEYAYHYKLRDCAMIVAEIRPGSFIISWFIPESIVKKLKENIPHPILKKYTVTNLEIAGVKVYPLPGKSTAPSPGPSAEDATACVGNSSPQPKPQMSRLSPEEDYPFVEKPSEDYFCPVTMGLLLQPHLTSCCGKHLSEESATRLQREGRPCPLCKSPDWSTVLNKHLSRQVRELQVFCRHKEKGCLWKGELSHFTQHLQSCQFRLLQDSRQGRTELHDAAERGDVEAVQRLLSTSVNINSRTETEGDTALLLASDNDHVEVVRLLLKAGAAVFIPDENGCSPLYVASHKGHTDIVDVLVKAGADVHQVTKGTYSFPLGVAAENGHTETVQRLLDAGANINSQSKYGQTPVWCASCNGHSAVVQLLIENGADISICDENGLSPLYVASQNGHTDIVDVLVKAGADVHQVTKEEYSVPLGIAAQNGHTETVQRLLDAGANINYQSKYGQTPVYTASWKGHSAVVQLLIENGADISICNEDGASPLYIASQYGHTAVVNILLEAGADVHQATTQMGGVPLGIAAQKGHTETVQRLLKEGANVNHQNKEGSTALFYAGWKGHTEVVKLLLGAGARDIPNMSGNTALSKARANNHTDVVQYLLQHSKV